MKIALLGNPNTGKSSVFNMLTGMRQQVGNFPGVTVDKRSGLIQTKVNKHQIIDFPGTYSIFAKSLDEQVVQDVLKDPSHTDYPDAILYIADTANLERNLLFFSQLYDLGFPCILVLNMWDRAQQKGLQINEAILQENFPAAKIVTANARVAVGKTRILDAIDALSVGSKKPFHSGSFHIHLETPDQQKNTEDRLQKIRTLGIVQQSKPQAPHFSTRIDRLLTHPIYGYLLFAALLLIIFQFIFSFASVPMDYIDAQFVRLSNWSAQMLPSGLLSKLFTQGLIPGVGGVLVFVPQIAILFFFIALLEESGYLSRVVFIMDRLMRPFGLNGKSVVPLLSSVACAIPGIMSARTISDWKERLITILVAPFMSCSARIPVYTLLINLVVPKIYIAGMLNLQGLVLFGLYFLGIVFALGTAFILKLFIKSKEPGYHLMELPEYKAPIIQNVLFTVLEKVKVFVLDAGKIIVAISILLWGLATFGPSSRERELKMLKSSTNYRQASIQKQQEQESALMLSESYIGHFGRFIEPVIQPLGYDWKIGVALLSSFAAREVFVGSLATIYAVGNDTDNEKRLIQKLRAEKNAAGEPIYTLATGLSLLIFYVFALQCMATLAVVRRETNTWRWPLIQLVFMGVVAYTFALIVYQMLL
ncbi:MAG: ferrous iron transporter B [Sphingomonadales bacterium]